MRQGRRGLGVVVGTLVAFAACAPVNRSLGDDLVAVGGGGSGMAGHGGAGEAFAGASSTRAGSGSSAERGGSAQTGEAGETVTLAEGGDPGESAGGAGGQRVIASAGAAGSVAGAGGATAGASGTSGTSGTGGAVAVAGAAGGNCFSPDHPEGALSGEPGCACPSVALACSIVDAPPLIGFKRLLHFSCDGHWQLSDTGMCPGAKCLAGAKSFTSGTMGVPDPFGCNTCTCWEGELINCTAKSSCLGQCPSGKKLANQCSQCGPGIACSELQTGCFDTCTQSSDCTDNRQCVSGLCRRSLCAGTEL